MLRQFLFFVGFVALLSDCPAQTTKLYKGKDSTKISLPLGDISFADKVIYFKKGNPSAIPKGSDSSRIIGPPDFDGTDGGFLTLGCKGEVVVEFTDNLLINIDGPDLYIFEQGLFVEPTDLFVSKDLQKWVFAGKISGGTANVSLPNTIGKGETFRYLKLRDAGTDCKGDWPGADIDAVAAIGSGKLFKMNSAVLFDVSRFELKNGAQKELQKIITEINKYPKCSLIINGYTDSTGTASNNLTLSKNRAQAVSEFIISKMGKNWSNRIIAQGFGEEYPIAPNNTAENKERNRRVEIIVVPQ